MAELIIGNPEKEEEVLRVWLEKKGGIVCLMTQRWGEPARCEVTISGKLKIHIHEEGNLI